MKLAADYESVDIYSGAQRRTIPAGGYICRIIEATENEQLNCIELKLDIAQGDFKDYYTERYARQIANGNDHPYFGGSYRVFNLNRDGTQNKNMKRLITSIEESNNVKLAVHGNVDASTMTGLYLGMLFGNVPYAAMDSNTRKYVKRDIIKPRFPCSVETINSGRFTIPKEAPLNERDAALLGFKEVQTKPEDDDDLPWA